MRRILLIILCFSMFCCPARAVEGEKYVALTFDDGPSGRFTRTLLKGLEERDVKATFLLCGYRMKEDPALTRRIFEQGHEIGIHGYSHNCMQKMSPEQIREEIGNTEALLPEGCRPAFFRPPGGLCSDAVCREAADRGLAILSWSVDPRDWQIHDAGAVTRTVVSHVRDGDVILLHDMSDSSVEAALRIVDLLKQRGFRFVTAQELARKTGKDPEPGKVYHRF